MRAQLGRASRAAVNERWELVPGEPSLDGSPGRVLVILHPEETAALDLLCAHYPRYVVLKDR